MPDYAEHEAALLPAAQKAQLHELADLMHQIYKTMIALQLLQPEGLILGPHDISAIRPTYEAQNLDPAIIYLYSILPYIDTHAADAEEFFQHSHFFNQLNEGDIAELRDPFYRSPKAGFEEEDGEYMRPWYTILSNCWERSSVMFYDAKEHKIWIVGFYDHRSTDPFFSKGWYGEEEEKSDWGGTGSNSEWEDEQEDDEGDIESTGSSEFWDDQDQNESTTGADLDITQEELDALAADRAEPVDFDEGFEVVEHGGPDEREEAVGIKNNNDLDLVRSRPAADVLRDINRWYADLKEVPFQTWISTDETRALYHKNGWPNAFDGEAFLVDVARTRALNQVKDSAPQGSSKQALRELQDAENALKYMGRHGDRHKKMVSEAKSLDEEWLAHLDLWNANKVIKIWQEKVVEAKEKVARLGPSTGEMREEDWPLWELEELRTRAGYPDKDNGDAAPPEDDWRETYKDDPKQLRHLEVRHRHQQREYQTLLKAIAASKADAERLCPGKTFEQATGMKSLRGEAFDYHASLPKSIVDAENVMAELKHFQDNIPQTAAQARERVDIQIKGKQHTIEDAKRRIAEREAYLASQAAKSEARKQSGGQPPRPATGGLPPRKKTGGPPPRKTT